MHLLGALGSSAGPVVARHVLGGPAQQQHQVASVAARQLPFVQYEPLVPKLNALDPFVDPAIEAVLLDLQTPEQAMRDACRRIRQVLERP